MCHLPRRFFWIWLLLGILTHSVYLINADAATLHLTWVDNSTDEDGFNIERKTGIAGAYAYIAMVGPNVISYTDSTLADGTTYCYRVNAFNAAGSSPYSPEACGTAPAVPVSSISTTTGSTLTVQVIGAITSGGNGSGKVVSQPRGLTCGSNCSAIFDSGAVVTLRAVPAKGSDFTGWGGDAACADGSVTMNTNVSCTATFQPLSQTLSVSLVGTGSGTVTSDLSGIDCGTSCTAEFARGVKVQLTATPAADSFFSGWSGDRDCSDATVRMKSDKTCTATFTKRVPANIGIYRPSAGAWYLTTTSTSGWQGCEVDQCLGPFGDPEDLPLTGNWDGSGTAELGVYNPEQKSWKLVVNAVASQQAYAGGSSVNFTVPQTSSSPQVPIAGSWDGSGKDAVGIYQLAPNPKGTKIARLPDRQWTEAAIIEASEAEGYIGYWYLDRNGNGTWDGCKNDRCAGPFGGAGDIPVVGDWNGNGVAKAGVFDPETGIWDLDYNGNGKWNGCKKDRCFGPFGQQGDIPVAGDWDGSGTSKIGVFRPSTGEWFLDMNGNGQWDGANVDNYIAGFGENGDLPVAGKW